MDTDKHEMKKVETILRAMSHELRSSLSNIALMVHNLQNIIPKLVHAYYLAKKSGNEVKDINDYVINNLDNLLAKVKNETDRNSFYLNLLNAELADISDLNFPISTCSMSACVSDIMTIHFGRYNMIVVKNEVEDFKFLGNKKLIEYILFNLLENAIYAISKITSGKIYLTISQDANYSYLKIEDTGIGVPKEILNKIFEKYFSTRTRPGLGLYFCYKAMQYMNGNIVCEISPQKHTIFILQFPKVS